MSRNSEMSNVIHSITNMNSTDVIYSDTNRIMLLFYDYNSLCIWPCNEDAKDEKHGWPPNKDKYPESAWV